MRVRKTLAVFGTGLVLAGCVMLYLMMDLALYPNDRGSKLPLKDSQWLHFEDRLSKLEKDFIQHHEAMNAIQIAAQTRDVVNSNNYVNNLVRSTPKPFHMDHLINTKKKQCSFLPEQVPQVDVQMLEIYKKLEFDNPNGGVWKQGWAIDYDEKQWHPTRKLKVFVVPHSHNDPGWLKTFEKYYQTETRDILNNLVSKLAEDKRRKFIWAEVSFLQLWWDEQNKETQDMFRQLVHDGQLEIVAGGWVMPDESSAHWLAQLTQLTEGHQWLKNNLDFVPKSSWSIDPFGLSPTMPYLLKGSGMDNLLIQRVHYSVKKRLARDKLLEFRWRQLWDNDGSSEMFTHMMPFYSYDVPHTCGPDPKVCCQFDFKRLPSYGLTCPWKVPPQVISSNNVAERSMLLLDQYRKKAQLYKTNALLIPLGDDFRYNHRTEWDAQYNNYQRLFDYMNSHSELNVKIQFGTLSDYFDAVRDEQIIENFPTLSGDFFTYSDRDDHYWSGYYTSRPFHKRLDRVLLGSLRSSEILAAIGWVRGGDQLAEKSLFDRLQRARRSHSLFQHHDGIAGTSRDHVVIDYAEKMITALKDSEHVLQHSVMHLLKSQQDFAIDPKIAYFTLDEARLDYTNPGNKRVLTFEAETLSRRVILYNPLPRQRTKIQTLLVSTPYVKVTDRIGHPVLCQISPIWVEVGSLSSAKFELSFEVTVPGLGLSTYLIHVLPSTSLAPRVHIANVTLYNAPAPPSAVPGFAHLQAIPQKRELSIQQRSEVVASFTESGLLKAMRVGNNTVPIHLEFVKYGTKPFGDRSGAYLFLPNKPDPDVIPVPHDTVVHVVEGPLLSRVYLQLPHLFHTCTLFNSPDSDGLGLHIHNEVDISDTQNFEIAMRLNTGIVSRDQFFTDLNGLNMVRRQRFPKLPTQGNYYPLPTAVYIEDERMRLTVATAQPLGVASMGTGQIEIMQDRRLMQDDNRGLSQPVTDNLLTNHIFNLVLEKRTAMPCSGGSPASNHPAGLLSLGAYLATQGLLHPIMAFHPSDSISTELHPELSPLRFDFPADIDIASLRVFPVPEGAGKGMGLVLHRQALDLCWGDKSFVHRTKVSDDGEVDLRKFLGDMGDWTISEAPLTFTSVGPSLKSPIINLCPHEILPILFHRAQS
ncbi:alpha-mannosidase 2 [Neodiprion virginianus]|uniref:alpha-mannosidase 2 n=1 Tax=Neodiprion virginianus TaxID=2961670 RepID=UPI001EE732CE|nr:alpha-mannosidase 2 [Neodiprion virginianus]